MPLISFFDTQLYKYFKPLKTSLFLIQQCPILLQVHASWKTCYDASR